MLRRGMFLPNVLLSRLVMIHRNAIHFHGVDHKSSAGHRPRIASPLNRHADLQIDSGSAARLKVQKVARIEDAAVDFSMQRVVQALDLSRETMVLRIGVVGFTRHAMQSNELEHPMRR